MKIVLFDLDKTLVDESYRATDSVGLTRALVQAKTNGILCGLNSDTPLPRLLSWHRTLGFDRFQAAPLIAENGALVAIGERTTYVSDSLRSFSALRKAAISRLDRPMESTLAICCDALEAVQNWQVGVNLPFGFKAFVFIDHLRECSFAAWYRSVNKAGHLLRDVRFARKCDSRLRAAELPVSDAQVAWDFNQEYCLTIIRDNEVTKTQGRAQLVQQYGGGCACYMVGDSRIDIIDLPSVVHCAVANASDDLKGLAAYTATSSHTQGCIEILSWIASHGGPARGFCNDKEHPSDASPTVLRNNTRCSHATRRHVQEEGMAIAE